MSCHFIFLFFLCYSYGCNGNHGWSAALTVVVTLVPAADMNNIHDTWYDMMVFIDWFWQSVWLLWWLVNFTIDVIGSKFILKWPELIIWLRWYFFFAIMSLSLAVILDGLTTLLNYLKKKYIFEWFETYFINCTDSDDCPVFCIMSSLPP